jgi:hypothetical protein
VSDMDESDHKGLVALVSQRRKKFERLEQQVEIMRRMLADAEMQLARLQQAMRGRKKADTLHDAIPQTAATKAARAGETCNAAGKALRMCKRAREQGDSADKLCGEAGKALRRCADAKKRGT